MSVNLENDEAIEGSLVDGRLFNSQEASKDFEHAYIEHVW